MIIRKLGRLIILLICGGLSLLGILAAGWFLLKASTATGRELAFVGLAIAILPITLPSYWLFSSRRILWRWSTLISGVIIIGVTGIILLMTPNGEAASSSPVSQHFIGDTEFQRYSLTNIIPEAEQVNVGFLFAPYLDPIITPEQARRVSAFTLDLYQEMEADPNFHRLGSVMGWAYAELRGLPFDVGHYYLYIPQNRTNGPLPAILFLHGSGGNFKAYTWAWSKFAEKQGLVIIAPSFGFGNWLRPGGTAAAARALEDAAKKVDIDPNRVYLAGLSNGGLGVSWLAATSPEQFRGLILLSPVMATDVVDSEQFHGLWRERPILVITGEVDQRVPINYVENRVSVLQKDGVDVTYIAYPGEDHFLFFSQLTNVLNDISVWISE